MDIIQVILLSIVEGFSEFLPISSTGHLILTANFLKISQTEFVKSFEIIIQLGAILAVTALYYKKVIFNKKILQLTIVAFLPTAIVGFTLYKLIKDLLIGSVTITLLALFWGGVLLIFFEKIYKEKETHIDSVEKLNYKNAFVIGMFQSLSIIPGVSRTAATIIGGMFQNLKRHAAVEFSFILAIPTMFAATTLDLLRSNFDFTLPEYFLLITGFIGAFATSLIVVKFFLRFVENHTFIPFGIYRIIISLLFWLIIIK